ncbi:MAG: hypothetical protein ACR2QE_20190 [Acidimicrobiales bacterium]
MQQRRQQTEASDAELLTATAPGLEDLPEDAPTPDDSDRIVC